MAKHLLILAVLLASPAAAQVTWSPTDKGANVVLSNGNLDASGAGAAFQMVRATQGRSAGKYCVDIETVTADAAASVVIGIANASADLASYPGGSPQSAGVQWMDAAVMQPYASGVARPTGGVVTATSTAGAKHTVCIDFATGGAWWGRNGVWLGGGNPATGTLPNVTGITGTWFPAVAPYNAANKVRLRATAAEMTSIPAGFAAWSDGAAPPPPSVPLWVYPLDSPYPVQAPIWAKVTGNAEVYINIGPPRQPVGPGATSTCWSASGACVLLGASEGQWMAVDLTQSPWNVPADAVYAEFRGIGGHSGGPASAGVVYRKPGDSSVACNPDHFSIQLMSEVSTNGGSRQNGTFRVPLVNGRFEYCWKASYLNGASFFWNASIIGWGR